MNGGWDFLDELAQVLVVARCSLQHELLDRSSAVEVSDLFNQYPKQLIDLNLLLPLHLRVHQHNMLNVFPEGL